MDPTLKCFSYSLQIDRELLGAEVKVNEAWIKMLARIKLIKVTESKQLLTGLRAVAKDLKSKDLMKLIGDYEDIHSLIQQSLEKKVGPLGKKLHTGRSRNDLVVTSTRIYLKSRVESIYTSLSHCQKAFLVLAEKAGDHIISGMTHLRMAQPVLMAHHLLAYVEMFEEDKERLKDVMKRLDVMPLGSAALAGSSLPIDQKFLATELGFSRIAKNSMAAVSDRGFMTEILSDLAIHWTHLSRLSEDFILWNSEAFGYIELDDAFATGSSLMPQKKNPDVFELIRGRSGVVFGHLTSLLTIQKGLPLAYNRDLQEDKPGLFDSLHKTSIALELLAGTLKTTTFYEDAMELSVHEETLFATDLLEYLVRKGMAFTEAHEAVGRVVRYASEKHKQLSEVSLKEWNEFSKLFDEDIFSLFKASTSVSAKKTIGSTNPTRVKSEIKRWKKQLK